MTFRSGFAWNAVSTTATALVRSKKPCSRATTLKSVPAIEASRPWSMNSEKPWPTMPWTTQILPPVGSFCFRYSPISVPPATESREATMVKYWSASDLPGHSALPNGTFLADAACAADAADSAVTGRDTSPTAPLLSSDSALVSSLPAS